MESTNIVFTERGKVEVLKQELPAPGAREIQCRAEISLISIGTELRCLYDQPQAGTSWSGWVKYPFLPRLQHGGDCRCGRKRSDGIPAGRPGGGIPGAHAVF